MSMPILLLKYLPKTYKEVLSKVVNIWATFNRIRVPNIEYIRGDINEIIVGSEV
jgi:hypothetical protein